MNKKQITEIITEGYRRLDPISNVDWKDYLHIMYKDELQNERQHRAHASFSPKFTASIVAKFFVIRAIRNAMRQKGSFRPQQILFTKQSWLIAHGVADDDRFDLKEMLNGFDWETFDSIDYQRDGLVCISE